VTPPRFRVASLETLEAIPGPGTLTWHPVRHVLGVHAFGTNAYTAAEAGADVVEPHSEDPDSAHEELYFVARGRARFTLDGTSFEAPFGTYVFVPDPAVHRHAVALEPATTVLSFGGPPTFTPSAWEWSFRANALRERDPIAAREIVVDGLRHHPDSPGLHFELARLEARTGALGEALAALRVAVEQEPGYAKLAHDDPDLFLLQGRPGFPAAPEA
jgi:hypothetical protein